MQKQEIEQERNTQHIYTVIFGQMSPEKPNAGKPVQQLRVLLLSSCEKFWVQLDAESGYPTEKNIGKNMVFITPQANPGFDCSSKWAIQTTFAQACVTLV